MQITSIPNLKVGTAFQKPSWRFDALSNPIKYGFKDYLSRNSTNAGYLARLISKGIVVSRSFKFPDSLRDLPLTSVQSDYLNKIISKAFTKEVGRKCTFFVPPMVQNHVTWNIKSASTITDSYFKKLILHEFNYQRDENITFAISIYFSDEYSEIIRFLGYSFYAGLDDRMIAKRWAIPVKKIEALRNIFFDFSHLPKNGIARWAMLRQLAADGDIDEEDFNKYKQIHRLGDLGVKALVDGYNLTSEERNKIERHLGDSAVLNMFEINFSIKSAKDLLDYNRAVTDFAKIGLQKEEIRQRVVATKLLELRVSELGASLNIDNNKVNAEDVLLYKEVLSKLSTYDHKPEYPDFESIKTK